MRAKEYIQIKNVGTLIDTGKIEIRPLTVITGNTLGGKGTLMKVISLMRYLVGNHNIHTVLDVIKDGVYSEVGELFMEDSYISYCIDGNEVTYEIKYDGEEFIHTGENMSLYDVSYNIWVSSMRTAIPFILNRVDSLNTNSLFGSTLRDFSKIIDLIDNFSLEYLGLSLKVQRCGNRKSYILTSEKLPKPINLDSASSGTKSLIVIEALMKYLSSCDRGSVYIEDPESNLDPYTQRNLVNMLVTDVFYNCTDGNLMFTTNSIYILSHLNVLLRASYHDRSRLYIDPENIIVYKTDCGGLMNLMMTDEETGEDVINTLDLSGVIEDIYNEYESL